MLIELFKYDKRHGWRRPDNYENIFTKDKKESLIKLDTSFLLDDVYFGEIDLDSANLLNQLSDIFYSYPFYKTHIKALAISITDKEAIFLNENFEFQKINWSSEYDWARKKISINKLASKPTGFNDILEFGDFVYLKENDGFFSLDQIQRSNHL